MWYFYKISIKKVLKNWYRNFTGSLWGYTMVGILSYKNNLVEFYLTNFLQERIKCIVYEQKQAYVNCSLNDFHV